MWTLSVSCVNHTRELIYLHDVLVGVLRWLNVGCSEAIFCGFFYGVALWKNYTKGSLNTLRSCYHKCVKIFFGYPKFHSVAAINLELSLPSFCTLVHNSCQDLVIARNPQFITCSVISHLTVDDGRVVRLFMFFTGVRRSVAACRIARPGEVGPLLGDKKLASLTG